MKKKMDTECEKEEVRSPSYDCLTMDVSHLTGEIQFLQNTLRLVPNPLFDLRRGLNLPVEDLRQLRITLKGWLGQIEAILEEV